MTLEKKATRGDLGSLFLFVLHSIGVRGRVGGEEWWRGTSRTAGEDFFAPTDTDTHTQHTCTNTERYGEMENQVGGKR